MTRTEHEGICNEGDGRRAIDRGLQSNGVQVLVLEQVVPARVFGKVIAEGGAVRMRGKPCDRVRFFVLGKERAVGHPIEGFESDRRRENDDLCGFLRHGREIAAARHVGAVDRHGIDEVDRCGRNARNDIFDRCAFGNHNPVADVRTVQRDRTARNGALELGGEQILIDDTDACEMRRVEGHGAVRDRGNHKTEVLVGDDAALDDVGSRTLGTGRHKRGNVLEFDGDGKTLFPEVFEFDAGVRNVIVHVDQKIEVVNFLRHRCVKSGGVGKGAGIGCLFGNQTDVGVSARMDRGQQVGGDHRGDRFALDGNARGRCGNIRIVFHIDGNTEIGCVENGCRPVVLAVGGQIDQRFGIVDQPDG